MTVARPNELINSAQIQSTSNHNDEHSEISAQTFEGPQNIQHQMYVVDENDSTSSGSKRKPYIGLSNQGK